ncbi:MAG: DNA gyrase inhibitor YacG [Sedimentisphaerales bacterium]|nr:DNA gyrase inhibitor YacG [Sedimentisphaerales bacterium]
MHNKEKCPICGKDVNRSVDSPDSLSPEDQGGFFPFCSQRCRLVDLNAWLDSDYRILSTPSDPTISGQSENTFIQ